MVETPFYRVLSSFGFWEWSANTPMHPGRYLIRKRHPPPLYICALVRYITGRAERKTTRRRISHTINLLKREISLYYSLSLFHVLVPPFCARSPASLVLYRARRLDRESAIDEEEMGRHPAISHVFWSGAAMMKYLPGSLFFSFFLLLFPYPVVCKSRLWSLFIADDDGWLQMAYFLPVFFFRHFYFYQMKTAELLLPFGAVSLIATLSHILLPMSQQLWWMNG